MQADTQLEDGTLCWCSHGKPVTTHSYACNIAREIITEANCGE